MKKTKAERKKTTRGSKTESAAAADNATTEAAEKIEDKSKDDEATETKDEAPSPTEEAAAAATKPAEEASTTDAKPSLSQQSKMRSSSFRQSISGPLSPGVGIASPILGGEDTAPEIYRKQAARIEELERENKRLTKEAGEGEKRYKKAEEELEVLREV